MIRERVSFDSGNVRFEISNFESVTCNLEFTKEGGV
jgi:hypothetical protein